MNWGRAVAKKMGDLTNRLFFMPLVEDERVQKDKMETAAKVQAFVTSQYYETFKHDLERMLKDNEVEPGQHGDMIHTSGKRAGLLLVRDYLERLEKLAKDTRNV